MISSERWISSIRFHLAGLARLSVLSVYTFTLSTCTSEMLGPQRPAKNASAVTLELVTVKTSASEQDDQLATIVVPSIEVDLKPAIQSKSPPIYRIIISLVVLIIGTQLSHQAAINGRLGQQLGNTLWEKGFHKKRRYSEYPCCPPDLKCGIPTSDETILSFHLEIVFAHLFCFLISPLIFARVWTVRSLRELFPRNPHTFGNSSFHSLAK